MTFYNSDLPTTTLPEDFKLPFTTPSILKSPSLEISPVITVPSEILFC